MPEHKKIKEQNSSGAYVIDSDYMIVSYNDIAKEFYPQLQTGIKCHKCMMGLDSPCEVCPVLNGVKGPQTYLDPIRKVYETVDAVPMKLTSGKSGYALIFSETEDKEELESLEDRQTRGAANDRRKLLIVEDNIINREILTELLEDEYDIFTASNGEEGLQMLSEHYRELSAVLLDVYMPVCDGFTFLERRKEDVVLSSIPTIVMTGSASQEDEVKCLELGAIDFIKKPYNEKIVRGRINSVIQLRESSMTLAAVERDELTDVYTRQAFLHHARVLMKVKNERSFHVIVGDVKNFKLINSIYGDKMGDNILVYLAKCFKKIAGKGLVSRYGSDQFVFIVRDDIEIVPQTIEKIIRDIEKNAPIMNLVVNYGVYTDVDVSQPITIICDRAFMAMKSIKNNYESKAAFYDKSLEQKRVRERMMEEEFEDAIENREFVVMYQPKYNVETEQIVGAEALVRWRKPDGTMISPGEFIPLFEQNGLIQRLDEYVFQEVCRIQSERMKGGCVLVPISVNLSRATLHHEDIVERYVEIVQENAIPFQCVPIEVTETVALQSIEIKGLTEKMIQVGFPLHMDDFGTGFSSITSLNMLPFDVLKLDKSLIDFVNQQKGRQVVQHLISLAHGLGMKVLSEGVETKEQVEFLRENECDEIQGFYYSKPQPYEVFHEMMERQRETA